MATAPTGREGAALVALRTMISESSTFQAWTGTGSAGAALARIHYGAIDNPFTATTPRPLAIVGYQTAEGHRRERVGAPRAYSHSGVVKVLFLADVTASDAVGEKQIKFNNNAGTVVDDVEDIANAGATLDAVSFLRVEGPELSDPDDSPKTGEFAASVYDVAFGVAE